MGPMAVRMGLERQERLGRRYEGNKMLPEKKKLQNMLRNVTRPKAVAFDLDGTVSDDYKANFFNFH